MPAIGHLGLPAAGATRPRCARCRHTVSSTHPHPLPLRSSNVAWQYGVSGPFWYASGATIQILLFGILAVEIKRKAPNAHTMLEIIRARWGNTAHKVGGRVAGGGAGGGGVGGRRWLRGFT